MFLGHAVSGMHLTQSFFLLEAVKTELDFRKFTGLLRDSITFGVFFL